MARPNTGNTPIIALTDRKQVARQAQGPVGRLGWGMAGGVGWGPGGGSEVWGEGRG